MRLINSMTPNRDIRPPAWAVSPNPSLIQPDSSKKYPQESRERSESKIVENYQRDDSSARPTMTDYIDLGVDASKEPTIVLESPTEDSSSAFASRKSFWMKFLDESQSLATGESKVRKTTTPIGREIQQTWSSGSPLSESSAFEEVREGSPHSTEGSSSMEVNEQVNMSTNTGVTQKWTNGIDNGVTQENIENQFSQRRASTGIIVTPSRVVASTGAVRPAPDSAQSTRRFTRSFADVTNRFNANANASVTQHQIKAASPVVVIKPRVSVKEAVEKLRGSQPNIFEKETKDEERGKVELTVSTSPTDPAEGENECGAISPSLDPVIEIGESTGTPISLSSSEDSPQEAATNSRQDQEKFQWAYDAWHKAGLLKKKVLNREHQVEPEKPVTAAPRLRSQGVFRTSSLDENETVRNYPDNVLKSVASADSEGSGFRSLLKKWRDKSDDKPNTHFLSPEQECMMREQKPSAVNRFKAGIQAKFSHQNLFRPSSVAACKPVQKPATVSKRIKKYDKDFFDFVREKQTPSRDEEDEHYHYEPEQSIERMSGDIISPQAASSGILATIASSDAIEESAMVPFADSEEADGDEEKELTLVEQSRALVILQNKDDFKIMVGETGSETSSELVIRNCELVTSNEQEERLTEYVKCDCSQSIFSGDDDLINFFLPQMGMACSCGKQSCGIVNLEDPTAIENILRPWQVEFLKSFGIFRGDQLVKARHRSADVMAKALRHWRKKKGMAPFKTTSCGMAIHIWAKTCKAYVRSVRKERNGGTLWLEHRPDEVARELTHFLGDLPAAPAKVGDESFIEIEPESQVEV